MIEIELKVNTFIDLMDICYKFYHFSNKTNRNV